MRFWLRTRSWLGSIWGYVPQLPVQSYMVEIWSGDEVDVCFQKKNNPAYHFLETNWQDPEHMVLDLRGKFLA